MIQAVAHGAEFAGQVFAIPSQQIVKRADALRIEVGLHGGPHAPDQPHRLAREEGAGFCGTNDGEAARFILIGRDLGEEFVVRQADGAREAKLGFHIADQPGEKQRGGCAVQAFGSSQV